MIRREPKAVLGWIGVWFLTIVVLGILQATKLGGSANGNGISGMLRPFGPVWVLPVVTLTALWVMTVATVYRSVMRPDEHGWRLFRLGADEARLTLVITIALVGVAVFGSVPGWIIYTALSPALGTPQLFAEVVPIIGTIATVCVEVWVAVRLSLTAIHTFSEGRFHVLGYWRLTEHRFWRLLASYLLVFVEFLVVLALFSAAVAGLGWLQQMIGRPLGLDLARRGSILGLAVLAGLLGSVFFVVPTIIFCACQAFAYKSIGADRGIHVGLES